MTKVLKVTSETILSRLTYSTTTSVPSNTFFEVFQLQSVSQTLDSARPPINRTESLLAPHCNPFM